MRRTKMLSSYFPTQTKSNQSPPKTVETGASNTKQNNSHVVLNADSIVADPRLRKHFEESDVDIRDAARRVYLQLAPS